MQNKSKTHKSAYSLRSKNDCIDKKSIKTNDTTKNLLNANADLDHSKHMRRIE